MKMFPHSFVPFFHAREKEEATKTSEAEKTKAPDIKRHGTTGEKPPSLDVETAVDLMLSAHNVNDDTMRQKYRLQIINTLPADAIDWKSVDWVQVWPFQTARS